jgi:predicted esterase
MGAMTDQQAQRVRDLLTEAGVRVEYRSFPTMGHAMHDQDPQLYVDTVFDWTATLES